MKRSSRSESRIRRRKAMGVHYTPPRLAEFVADRLIVHVSRTLTPPLRILDPACGNGVLLEAFLRSLENAGARRECDVVGVEADPLAATAAESRLTGFNGVRVQVIRGDFLDLSGRRSGQAEFWESHAAHPDFDQAFDMIIANPPYVRTQVLGAEKAQRLGVRYGLTGRVDLYHAFFVAATQTLRPGGVIGIITSNRFLSTIGAGSIRRYLARQYEIEEVIDLGDTKLFEAAVLPAIFVGRRRTEGSPPWSRRSGRFTKVYSQPNLTEVSSSSLSSAPSIYDVLRSARPGCYRVPQGIFKIDRGDLVLAEDPTQVWSLTTREEAEWLARIRLASHGLFGDVARVRVGIKTTADEVFIRSNWNTLPRETQPEPELLRDILTHEEAGRWSLPRGARPSMQVLYPHEVSGGRRKPVDLNRYPRAKSYLESHRKRLEKRQYVLDAGRQWYEIWVPQDPDAWAAPKIVFPDISPKPRFYLDLDGYVVNGDCYWMTLRTGVSRDMIYLLLAVANSSLMAKFHDLAFNNKLYSGRRRYITQYVAKYPLPDPASVASRNLIALSKRLVHEGRRKCENRLENHPLSTEVDALVESTFGLNCSKVAR